MAFSEFLAMPELRVSELDHSTTANLPMFVANLLLDDLGPCSFRGKGFSSWYGSAVYLSLEGALHAMPFALRVTDAGECALTCRHHDKATMVDAIATLVPDLTMEVIPGRRAA